MGWPCVCWTWGGGGCYEREMEVGWREGGREGGYRNKATVVRGGQEWVNIGTSGVSS